jgi:hypothetical protein
MVASPASAATGWGAKEQERDQQFDDVVDEDGCPMYPVGEVVGAPRQGIGQRLGLVVVLPEPPVCRYASRNVRVRSECLDRLCLVFLSIDDVMVELASRLVSVWGKHHRSKRPVLLEPFEKNLRERVGLLADEVHSSRLADHPLWNIKEGRRAVPHRPFVLSVDLVDRRRQIEIGIGTSCVLD